MKYMFIFMLFTATATHAEEAKPHHFYQDGFVYNAHPDSLRIDMGDRAIVINFETGKITHKGYTPDQAAEVFWDAVERAAGHRLACKK